MTDAQNTTTTEPAPAWRPSKRVIAIAVTAVVVLGGGITAVSVTAANERAAAAAEAAEVDRL